MILLCILSWPRELTVYPRLAPGSQQSSCLNFTCARIIGMLHVQLCFVCWDRVWLKQPRLAWKFWSPFSGFLNLTSHLQKAKQDFASRYKQKFLFSFRNVHHTPLSIASSRPHPRSSPRAESGISAEYPLAPPNLGQCLAWGRQSGLFEDCTLHK